MSSRAAWLPVLVVLVLTVGCSPSLSPLYRDYKVQTADAPTLTRIAQALESAGWDTVAASTPNVIATKQRGLNNWGLYKVVVSIEAAPVGDAHVRLFFHPYRQYITGGRSKIPYLNGSLRRTLLRDLNAAFEEQGLLAIGSAIQRDREATDS